MTSNANAFETVRLHLLAVARDESSLADSLQGAARALAAADLLRFTDALAVLSEVEKRVASDSPRTPETVLRATLSRLRDAINNPPDGDDNDWKSAMRAALREHEAAIAGTAPLGAPPAKS